MPKEMPGGFAGHLSPIQDLENSNDGSAAGDQVDDEHDQRGNQQQVNQAAGYMQTEPEEPKNQQNGKYGPEHRPSLLSSRKLRWECLWLCCLSDKQLYDINFLQQMQPPAPNPRIPGYFFERISQIW